MGIYSKVLQQIEELSVDVLLEIERQVADNLAEIELEYEAKLSKLAEVKNAIQKEKDLRGIINGVPAPVLHPHGFIKYQLGTLLDNHLLLNDAYTWYIRSPAGDICPAPELYFRFENERPLDAIADYNITRGWGEDTVIAHDALAATALASLFGGVLSHIITGKRSAKKLTKKLFNRVWITRKHTEGTGNEGPDLTRTRAVVC